MRSLIITVVVATAATLLSAAPVHALDVYVNGTKANGIKMADLTNCQVKFDALGNVHVLSPGYRVLMNKKGKPARIVGSSDFGGTKTVTGKPNQRYVLLYRPNPKVAFTFEVHINGKKFRNIDLSTGAFTVDLTSSLLPGANQIRVIGKPTGTAPPTGTEADVAKLRILAGHERADGAFVAKHPAVWELVRAAIDRNAIDRTSTISVR
jgi:hypothetical protein